MSSESGTYTGVVEKYRGTERKRMMERGSDGAMGRWGDGARERGVEELLIRLYSCHSWLIKENKPASDKKSGQSEIFQDSARFNINKNT